MRYFLLDQVRHFSPQLSSHQLHISSMSQPLTNANMPSPNARASSVPTKYELGSKSRNSFNTHDHLLSGNIWFNQLPNFSNAQIKNKYAEYLNCIALEGYLLTWIHQTFQKLQLGRAPWKPIPCFLSTSSFHVSFSPAGKSHRELPYCCLRGELTKRAWWVFSEGLDYTNLSEHKNCITPPYFIQVVWTSVNTHTTEISHVYSFPPPLSKISAISLARLGRTF